MTDLTDERRAYLERKGWEVFWQNGRFECTNPKHPARYPWLVSRALHMEEFADAAVNAALEKAAVRVLDAAKRMEAMDDFGLEPTWESTLKTYGPRKFVGLFIGTVAQNLAANAQSGGSNHE